MIKCTSMNLNYEEHSTTGLYQIMTQDYLNFIKVNIVDFRSSTSFMCIVFVLYLVLRCMIKEKQLLLLRDIQIYFNIVKRVVTVFRHIDSLSRRALYMDMQIDIFLTKYLVMFKYSNNLRQILWSISLLTRFFIFCLKECSL